MEQLLLEIGDVTKGPCKATCSVYSHHTHYSNAASKTEKSWFLSSITVQKFRMNEKRPASLGIQRLLKGVKADKDFVFKVAATSRCPSNPKCGPSVILKWWTMDIISSILWKLNASLCSSNKRKFRLNCYSREAVARYVFVSNIFSFTNIFVVAGQRAANFCLKKYSGTSIQSRTTWMFRTLAHKSFEIQNIVTMLSRPIDKVLSRLNLNQSCTM